MDDASGASSGTERLNTECCIKVEGLPSGTTYCRALMTVEGKYMADRLSYQGTLWDATDMSLEGVFQPDTKY